MLQFSNSNRVMETREHSKNGASLKSQMSRGNFFRKVCFALLTVCVIFSGCSKNDDNDKGNETGSQTEKETPVVAKVKFANKRTTNTGGLWVIDINATGSYSSAGKIVKYVYTFGSTSNTSEVYTQTAANSSQPYMGIWSVPNSPNIFNFHAMVEVYDEKGNKGTSEWIETSKP